MAGRERLRIRTSRRENKLLYGRAAAITGPRRVNPLPLPPPLQLTTQEQRCNRLYREIYSICRCRHPAESKRGKMTDLYNTDQSRYYKIIRN